MAAIKHVIHCFRCQNAERANGRRQQGFTLVEVLVALLVLSIGLLGLAGLQISGLQSNHSAYLRSQASIFASDIIDRMRSNRSAAMNGDYDRVFDDASDLPSAPPAMTLAQNDLSNWGEQVLDTLPGVQGTLSIDANNIVTVSLQWDDSRADRSADRSGAAVTDDTTFNYQTEL